MKKRQTRVVTISDGIDCATGFGVQHKIIASALATVPGCEVYALGLWDTTPHRRDCRVTVVPCGPRGVDDLTDRWGTLHRELAPDVLVTMGDLRMFPAIIKDAEKDYTWLHFLPVDGDPFPSGCRGVFQRMDWLLLMSEYGARTVRAEAKHAVRTRIMPLAVDTKMFTPCEDPMEFGSLRARWSQRLKCRLHGKHVLVCHDTNSFRKNTPALLEMMTYLPDDVLLVLHCSEKPRPGSYGWDLPAIARHEGVADRVLFTGHGTVKPNERPEMKAWELASLIQMADLRVSATTGEGFGVGTIEAMACGVPTVITDCTTSGEVLGAGGLLAKVGQRAVQPGAVEKRYYVDPEDMASCVLSLFAHDDAYESCSSAGIERVAKRYAEAHVASLWRALMQEVLDERSD